MKNNLKVLQARSLRLASGTAALSVLTVSSAHAALPQEATDAMTAVATDGASMVGLGWAIAAAVTGGLVMIGIFKKAANKAT